MPAIYQKHGIRFQYPENWSLDEADLDQNSVTVYSPGGGFWSVVWRDPGEDPHFLAVEALQTMKKEYAETESEPVTEVLADQEVSGFDISFYYLDLTNSAQVRGFRTANASYLVLCQAEDREFRDVESVFQAMTVSLLTP